MRFNHNPTSEFPLLCRECGRRFRSTPMPNAERIERGVRCGHCIMNSVTVTALSRAKVLDGYDPLTDVEKNNQKCDMCGESKRVNTEGLCGNCAWLEGGIHTPKEIEELDAMFGESVEETFRP